MATIATSATLSMTKSQAIQAEVPAEHCNAARTANHSSVETREAAETNKAKRQIKALKASSEHTT